MILKYIYTLFVGILLALFVGVGIAAFYQQPKSPEYPPSLSYPKAPQPYDKMSTDSSQMLKEQEDFNIRQKAFQAAMEQYQRNVSIIALSAAIIFLVISLTLLRNLLVITDGVMLGGVFTLIYSIMRGLQSPDTLFRFLVVTVGLTVVLILGYIKFIKPAEGKK